MKTYVSDGEPMPARISYFSGKGETSKAIVECKNGGYIIGESSLTWATKGVATDGWICKVNSEGEKLWDTAFGAIGGDNILTIIEDEEENIVVTGTRYNKLPSFKISLWFLKFSAEGDLKTEQYYNQGNVCIGGASVKLSSDRFIIIGSSNNSNNDKWVRTGEISQQEKERLIEIGWEVIMIGEDEYLENDNTRTGIDRINEDNYLVLVNSKGDQLWDYVYGGNEDDKLTSICKNEKGEVYAAGYTYSKGNGLKDIAILRLE